jgi:serine/threonine protein kinase
MHCITLKALIRLFSTGVFIDFNLSYKGQYTGAIFASLLGKDLSWHDSQLKYDFPHQYLPWMRDLAYSLAVLHAIGMVHVDLSPQNIMISQDESRAYLSDFGTTFDVPPEYLKPPSHIGPQTQKTDFLDSYEYLTAPYEPAIFDQDGGFFGFLLLRASKKLRNTPIAQKCKWEIFHESKQCLKDQLSELSTELKSITHAVCKNKPICYERIVAQALEPDLSKRLALKDIYVYLREILNSQDNFDATVRRLQEP